MTLPTTSNTSMPIRHFPFDPDSPLFVAKAVLTSATCGGVVGASIGVAKFQNPFQLSVNMSINSGMAGLAFFSIREYFVSPVLLALKVTSSHNRRYEELSEKARGKQRDTTPSIADIRVQRILDSAIAGALSGGSLSWVFRGGRTAVPAAVTSATIASLLQFSVNQVRVVRLELLARSQTSSSSEPSMSSNPPETVPLIPSATSTEETIAMSMDNPVKAPGAQRGSSVLSGQILSGLSKFLPVHRLSDDEYLALLEKKLEKVDSRMREIDDEQQRMFARAEQEEQEARI